MFYNLGILKIQGQQLDRVSKKKKLPEWAFSWRALFDLARKKGLFSKRDYALCLRHIKVVCKPSLKIDGTGTEQTVHYNGASCK